MAVTAKFVADFSGFLDAVTRAETKLRDFGSGAASVEKSLNRMVDNFSGRKLIEDATKAAEAVERIGGASKLTAAELEKVSAQAAAAADKMGRMGIDVPPKIAALASQVKNTSSEFANLKDIALSAATGLGVAFSATALVSGLKSALESSVAYGNELQNLSLQSGTNVVAFQRLATATSAYGIDADLLAREIFQLSRRIAGDDQGAVAVIGRLGVSLERLKTLSPDQMFIQMAQAVAKVDAPLVKAGDSAALFGARAGAAVGRLPKDFAELVDQIGKTNNVMDEQAVEAAHRFTVAIDQLERGLKSMLGNALSPALEGLSKFIEQSRVIFNPQGNAPPAPPLSDKLSLDAAKKQLADLGPAPLAGRFKIDTTDLDSLDEAKRLLASLDEQIKPLTAHQQAFLEQLFDMGRLTKENAEAYKINTAQLDIFKKKEEEIIQTQATMATQLLELKNIETEVWRNAAKATDEANKATQRRLDLLDRLRVEDTIAGNAAVTALGERGNPKPTDAFNKALDARDEARRKASDVDPNLQTSAGPSVMAALLAKAEADFDDAVAAIQGGGQKIAGGLGTVADVTHAGASVVEGAFRSIQGVVDAATSKFSAERNPANNADAYLQDLSTQGFRNTQGLGSTLFNLFNAPRRATGGAVMSGSAYWVGEQGPELFTPTSSGAITPNGAGGHTFNITVVGATGADHAVLAARIKAEILNSMRSSHRA